VTARLRKLLDDLTESFWLLPAFMVAVGVVVAWAIRTLRSTTKA